MILDTGPLVAVFNGKDDDHQRCLELLQNFRGPLLVPAPVLSEVSHFVSDVRRGGGAEVEASFLEALSRDEFSLIPTLSSDLARMAELVRRYGDLPLGAVDASVVAIAERLGVHKIATLDRRHFGVVRPRHLSVFTLLP